MALEVKFLQKRFSPAAERAISKIAVGLSHDDAAKELHRDKETIKSYAAVFRQVMNARSTLEAVAKAIASGVISIKEVDGKTLLACGFIALTSFHSDFTMAKTARTAKTKRREDAITQSENGGQVAGTWHQGVDVCSVVPVRLSDRTIR